MEPFSYCNVDSHDVWLWRNVHDISNAHSRNVLWLWRNVHSVMFIDVMFCGREMFIHVMFCGCGEMFIDVMFCGCGEMYTV